MTERIATSPGKRGLYDPAFERDSCGFGLIAHLHGEPSHRIVSTAVEALERLFDGREGGGPSLVRLSRAR